MITIFYYIKLKGLSIFLYTKMQIITPLEIWYSCGFAVTLGLAAAVPGAYARSPAGEHIATGRRPYARSAQAEWGAY